MKVLQYRILYVETNIVLGAFFYFLVKFVHRIVITDTTWAYFDRRKVMGAIGKSAQIIEELCRYLRLILVDIFVRRIYPVVAICND